MSQKIFIKTFGCQMNEYDSNRIFDIVKKIGFQKTENYEDANCYLLNTCHIRDKAKEKVYHEIGRVKKIFRSKKKPLVIVGDGVRKDNSINELISFIDNLNAAVLSSMKARGVYKENRKNENCAIRVNLKNKQQIGMCTPYI